MRSKTDTLKNNTVHKNQFMPLIAKKKQESISKCKKKNQIRCTECIFISEYSTSVCIHLYIL